MEKKKFFKNEHCEMWIEDGILFTIYFKGVRINGEAARNIIRERLKICEGITYPCLIDISQGPDFDSEARKIFSTGDAMKDVNAGCIIVKNQIQKLLYMLFISINKPAKPAKSATSTAEAVKWLSNFKSHKDQNQSLN